MKSRTPKKIPMRQCVGCRQMKPKKEMLRVIKATSKEDESESEGGIFLDATGKKNGRGAYLCRDSECLKAALKNRGLERSLKTSVPEDVFETLTKEMEELDGR